MTFNPNQTANIRLNKFLNLKKEKHAALNAFISQGEVTKRFTAKELHWDTT